PMTRFLCGWSLSNCKFHISNVVVAPRTTSRRRTELRNHVDLSQHIVLATFWIAAQRARNAGRYRFESAAENELPVVTEGADQAEIIKRSRAKAFLGDCMIDR